MKQVARHSPRFVLPLLGLALLVLASGCSGGAARDTTARASAADPGARPRDTDRIIHLDFPLGTADGSTMDLSKFDGTIRVVDFWATWCPPCRMAIPHLNELYRKYKDQGVSVLGISVDENPKVLLAFDKEIHIEYPSLLTADKAEDAFGGIVGLPSTFILDKQGRIYKSYIGEIERETLEGDVQALLAAK